MGVSLELAYTFPTLLELSTEGKAFQTPFPRHRTGLLAVQSRSSCSLRWAGRGWGLLQEPRPRVPLGSGDHVAAGSQGQEPDMSFLSFAEIVAVWDAVSDYILEQMKLDKVGWGAGGPRPGQGFGPAESVGPAEQSLPGHHTEQHAEPKPGAQSSLLANWEGNPRPELP